MCYLLGILQCKIDHCKMGKRLTRWLIVVLGWVLVVRTGVNVVRLLKAGDRVTEAEKELEMMQRENENLTRELRGVKTPEYMERLAREKLGYGKEGEVVVVIDPTDLEASVDKLPKSESEQVPNWKRWRRLYLGF